MSIFNGYSPSIFCRQMEKMQPTREEKKGKVFHSRKSRHFLFVNKITKELFCFLYLELAYKRLCFQKRKRFWIGVAKAFSFRNLINTKSISRLSILRLVVSATSHISLYSLVWLKQKKNQFSLHHCLTFSLQKMATLWNKRKLEAVAKNNWRNILGMASHETRPFLESMRNAWARSPRRLKTGSVKNCTRNSAGESPAFWVFCLN